MFNVRLIKAEGLRRFLVLAFYLGLLIVAVKVVSSDVDMAQKAPCLIVFLFVPIALWLELKRYIYVRANHELNEEDKPQSCLDHTRFVIKFDWLLKQYQNLAPFQEGYALLDLDRADEIKETLESRFGRRYELSKGRNFEHSYLLFLLSAVKKEQKKVKEHFEQIDKIFSSQQRLSGDLITLRYYIEAIYYTCTGEAKKAIERFEGLDLNAFKKRELTYYHYFLAKAYTLDHQYEKADESYRKAIELSPNNRYIANHPISGQKTK